MSEYQQGIMLGFCGGVVCVIAGIGLLKDWLVGKKDKGAPS